jgi:hypothetical protein
LKQSGGQQITLDSKVEKYAEHLQLGNTNLRGSLMMTIEYLKAHGLTKEIAKKYQLGLVNPADYDDRRHAGRLAIPYLTRGGSVVAMKYRCVEGHKCKDHGHQKYLAPEGQENWIFNPQAFFDADDVIGVAEGEIDAIVATERLGLPTIGIPGVEIWTQNRKSWRHALADYEKVLIFVDGDTPDEDGKEAGKDFARAVAADVRGRGRLVYCDHGMDVASMVATGRINGLKEKAGL